jgi:uncharacterized membrane protein
VHINNLEESNNEKMTRFAKWYGIVILGFSIFMILNFITIAVTEWKMDIGAFIIWCFAIYGLIKERKWGPLLILIMTSLFAVPVALGIFIPAIRDSSSIFNKRPTPSLMAVVLGILIFVIVLSVKEYMQLRKSKSVATATI